MSHYAASASPGAPTPGEQMQFATGLLARHLLRADEQLEILTDLIGCLPPTPRAAFLLDLVRLQGQALDQLSRIVATTMEQLPPTGRTTPRPPLCPGAESC